MKKLRVTLVVPNFRWTDSDENALWHFIPYNLCLLAAMIEDICDVNILDAYDLNMNEDEFKVALKRLKPDIVGITVLLDQYAHAGHTAAKIAKTINKDITVIIGGVYATTNPLRAIEDPNIDFVIIGEGEYVLRDLAGCLMDNKSLPEKGICYRQDGKVVNRGHSDFILDLDKIPLPAYHLIDYNQYANNAHRRSVDAPRKYPYARIMTSRGCPFQCIFCQVGSIMGTKFRGRSAENVLAEIQFLKDKYGIQSIIFDDDNLFNDKKRAKDIFQGMIDRNLVLPWVAIAVAVFKLDEELIKVMKASGCEFIDVAIESGSKRVLKEIINKPVDFKYAKEMIDLVKKEGIFVSANFIIGFPTETWNEIRQTIEMAEKIGVDYAKIFTAIPLHNTRLWELCKKENAFKKGAKTDKIWSTGQIIETDEFTANEVTILRAFEWDRINFTDSQKRKKTAAIMNITEEELSEIRKKTLYNACKAIR